jgi:hypothetical protein
MIMHDYVLKDDVFQPTTMAGFDLTTHRSSLLGGRRRLYHKTTSRQGKKADGIVGTFQVWSQQK